MPKPKTDFQRQRVWNAQRSRGAHGFPQMTDTEIIELVTKIVKSSWFRRQVRPGLPSSYKQVLGARIDRMPSYTHCSTGIAPMARRRNAAPAWTLVLKLGPDERTLPEVLHPLVHLIDPDPVGGRNHWHNQTFCKAWLAMIARFVGVDAKKQFQTVLRSHSVKCTVVSDEARAARSDAMKHRRSKEVLVPDLLALRDELAGGLPS